MSGFTITRRGQWAAGAGDGSLARAYLTGALGDAAQAIADAVADASPYRTGRLFASWQPLPVTWAGSVGTTGITSDAPYAEYQNTRTVNAGYIERGVQAGMTGLQTSMENGLNDLAAHLWENG